jgi:hypothetical protein
MVDWHNGNLHGGGVLMITLGLGFGVVRYPRAAGTGVPVTGALSHTLLQIGLTTPSN